MKERDEQRLEDYAAPTEAPPDNAKQMLERRRHLSAGQRIAGLHDYAQKIMPGFHADIMKILEKNGNDASIIGRALSFVRDKVGGYKQVLTDGDMKKLRSVYQKVMSVFYDDIPPKQALDIVTECNEFALYLTQNYSDKMGVHAIHEIYMLLELSQIASANYGFWLESAGYILPYERWVQLGRPNVNASVPMNAAKVTGNVGGEEKDLFARMPKIEAPKDFRGDFFDLNGVRTTGGSGGKV